MKQNLDLANNENRILSADLERKHHEIKHIKNQYNSKQTDKVIEQFADQADKVHDLEYLVRNKERQIEILRGELTESRQMHAEAEDYIEKMNYANNELEKKNSEI